MFKMMTINNYPWEKYCILIAVILLFSACGKLPIQVVSNPSTQIHEGADLLFINGDFQNALSEYEQIYKTSSVPEDRNIALYGLACTQLMLAHNDHQYIEAISTLQKWDAAKGSAPFIENHHLLVLALIHHRNVIQEKHRKLTEREKNKNLLISRQKKKLSKMVTIINKLQNQLEELEAIDKTFQEKRKPL